MMRFAGGLILLLLALPAAAQNGDFGEAKAPLSLPAVIKGEPNSLILVKAITQAKQVRWYAVDRGLSIAPFDLLKDTRTAVVFGPAGSYRLLAYTCTPQGPTEPAVCLVEIGERPPGPSPVPPGPGPVPPVPPPVPPIPPPPPVDPLLTVLQAAYASDVDPQKAQHLANLAALYNQAATSTVPQPQITTVGGLFDVMASAAASLGLKGKLMPVQQAIQSELVRVLPVQRDAPLDQATREVAARAFARVGSLLTQVKP